jgi:hypothetical protein
MHCSSSAFVHLNLIIVVLTSLNALCRLFGSNWCSLCLKSSMFQAFMPLNRLYCHSMLLDAFQDVPLTLVTGK